VFTIVFVLTKTSFLRNWVYFPIVRLVCLCPFPLFAGKRIIWYFVPTTITQNFSTVYNTAFLLILQPQFVHLHKLRICSHFPGVSFPCHTKKRSALRCRTLFTYFFKGSILFFTGSFDQRGKSREQNARYRPDDP